MKPVVQRERTGCGIASVAGFSPTELAAAARGVEPFVDAVEIGLVCPNSTETERMARIMVAAASFIAVAMGLANVCVPHEELDATVQECAETICERSPTAIAIAKRSFNMDTAHQSGIAGMGMYALKLYYDTEESREGVKAFNEKRKADFKKYQT